MQFDVCERGFALRRGWGGGERSTSRTYWTAAPITYTNEETMRKVIIKKANKPSVVEPGTPGVLLTWGQDGDGEGGTLTIAIVELSDGSVIEAYPTNIQFVDPIMAQVTA